jgi:hypothetical protein
MPITGTLSPAINVAGRSIRVSAGSKLQAFPLLAPESLLSAGRGAKFVGSFCVFRLRTDKNIELICPNGNGPNGSPSGAFLGDG